MRSWTTFSCCPRGDPTRTIYNSWQRSSTFRQASMQARHVRGTRVGRGHQMSTIWDQTCGMVRALRYWARQLVPTPSCVQSHTDERLEEENRLWEAMEWVRDAQCAWQILVQCAGPRCHHLSRTMMPHNRTWVSALLPSPCVSVDWDSVPPTGRLPQRIGLRGPMPCRCSPDVCRN